MHTNAYEVLLSYPDYDNPNTVTMKDKSGSVLWKTSGFSPSIIKEEQSDPSMEIARHLVNIENLEAGIQWLAYAAPGTVTSDVVYVNYGTTTDYTHLKNMGVSVEVRILQV